MSNMPRADAAGVKKNKLGLKLPEVPKDASEQNHSENGYVQQADYRSIRIFLSKWIF